MRLADLEKLCGALNFSTAQAKEYLYDNHYDFRKQTTSLHQSHFPILVYAALVAAGVKDQDIVPYPIEITQFIAPIFLSTSQSQLPSQHEIKQQAPKNGNFNKRLSTFLDSKNKDKEDFMAVAVSDSSNPGASHGVRVHLVKKNNDFSITIFDSAVGDGKEGDKAAQESPHFLWLSAYIAEIIKSTPVYRSSEIEISAKASPHQLAHLCYDHTAFELAEFILNKMGKECHFIIPEKKGDGQNIPLREKLYQAHERTGDVNDKIQLLVIYIKICVLKQELRNSVKESKDHTDNDARIAAELQKQFEDEYKQVLKEHEQLRTTEKGTALNRHRILPAPVTQGYQRLRGDAPQPADQSACCSCLIL